MSIGIYTLWPNLSGSLMLPVLKKAREKDGHHFIVERWRYLVEAFELQIRVRRDKVEIPFGLGWHL